MNLLETLSSVLRDKRGAVAVLLMAIMGSFILIIGVLIAASASASGKSYSDATLQLSGKSILSEYDRKLLDEYGLLCFRGDEREMEKKLKYYANASFDPHSAAYSFITSNKKRVDMLNLRMNSMVVNLKEYSMLNVDLYEDQIKKGLAGNLVKKEGRNKTDKKNNRTLRNEIVIDSLPSFGYKSGIFPTLDTIKNIPDWGQVKNSTTGKFASNEYIMITFKHANEGNLNKETFFNNEIEYILEGKMGDDDNYRGVITKIIAMRFALNSAYLITDPQKMAEITKLAAPAAVAAGIGMAVAEAAIFAAWVTAETENDIKLLEDGHKVSLVKTRTNWALNNLEDIVNDVVSKDAVKPSNKDGQSYSDYLRILLYLMDREAKLLRMMDLTQINMKGTYYREFLIKEYYAGFRFNAKIKGDEFDYVQQY